MHSVFILIHGGWAGAWQWEGVVPLLEDLGHTIFTPCLTGLWETRELASPDINVSTHIGDVCTLIRSKNLFNVHLVGFSYGGMVATGTAKELPDRIESLIYLDAFFPLPGQALFDIFGKRITRSLDAMAEAFGDGWRLPYFDRYDERLTDQPAGTGREPVHYSDAMFDSIRTVYIECIKKPEAWSFTEVLTRIAEERRAAGWDVRTFPSDHFPMTEKPNELAVLLDSFIREKQNGYSIL